MEEIIRIGSRKSVLAIKQAQIVIEMLKEKHPNCHFELVTMTTTGDEKKDIPLQKIGGKGLFVKELDRALLEDKVDLTVHSLKDMPMEEQEEIPILAYVNREEARDVLVLRKGQSTFDMAQKVGCSSLRRTVQLQEKMPQVQMEWIRGNIQTRLSKLDKGDYGALILAGAGLKRLGLEERIEKYFSTDEMVPAAGQGMLAIQGKPKWKSFVEVIKDEAQTKCALLEREFVKMLGGGCHAPVGAYAEQIDDVTILFRGMAFEEQKVKKIKTVIRGTQEQMLQTVRRQAQSMKGDQLSEK